MSAVQGRDQFRTDLKCRRCAAVGYAVWEENSAMDSRGPMSELISLSDGFIQSQRKLQGQPEIACAACGAKVPD